ncbi:hypothetical protein L6164_031620 [Bauhinia variegata]|uniref:Uncharacterized protein n=1 Tax=Bauhinia variegata TaxID=167791 RepID=A0ACB9LFK0_BAUVA|nr:hypothetical protein L6164_031620 [Bauhinia variegata]
MLKWSAILVGLVVDLKLYSYEEKRKEYVNDKKKIIETLTQQSSTSRISPNDALGVVLCKEHSGRVCGVGIGLCPSKLVAPLAPIWIIECCIGEYDETIVEDDIAPKPTDRELEIDDRASKPTASRSWKCHQYCI